MKQNQFGRVMVWALPLAWITTLAESAADGNYGDGGGDDVCIDDVVYQEERVDGEVYGDDVALQVRYVKEHQFGGVMVWALPLDDFSGSHCGQGPFPLMHAINDECQHTSGYM